MIEKVVTAIKLRWPDQGLNRTVVIQHDGASCHIEGNDVQLDQAAEQGVWNILLRETTCQESRYERVGSVIF